MKGYFRTVAIIGVLCALAIVLFVIVTGRNGGVSTDREEAIVKLNDIVYDALEHWDHTSALDQKGYEESFVIVDSMGTKLYSSHPGDIADERISVETAIKRNYLYRPVIKDGRVLGYVMMLDGADSFKDERIVFAIVLGAVALVLIVAALLFGLYVKRSIIDPFRKLKGFAGRVAEGKLDEPLLMDKNNMFGAFSESFDIMREELFASREREIALQRRERELVASLSHDLKTPVTGIKLTCEVLKAKLDKDAAGSFMSNEDAPGVDREGSLEKQSRTGAEITAISDLSEKIDNIYKKADQIDVLVTDLLSSTMEELNELKVNCTDESSAVLADIVGRYDDKGRASSGELPEVMIHIDVKRMSQVIGNIISNSYKYADTELRVSYRIVDDFLEMRIDDFGPGVPEDELELITNKFYRGKQWADSKLEGSGLGLYISKLLMEKMDGEIVPENTEDGFGVVLLIPLS